MKDARGHRPAHARSRDNTAGQDGFLAAALHSITHTVPRSSLRRRLVPWSLAIAMTIGTVAAGAGLVLAQYRLLWSAVGAIAVLALFGAVTHPWRDSTRYKRPLQEPTGPPRTGLPSGDAGHS